MGALNHEQTHDGFGNVPHLELPNKANLIERIFKSSVFGLMLLGLDRKIIAANPAFCNIIGYTEAEIASNTFSITFPDDVEEDNKNLDNLINGVYPFRTLNKRYIHKNGSIRWVEHTSFLLNTESGDPELFIIQVVDVTDKISTKVSLKESEANLQAIFNASPDIVMLCETDGRVITINNTYPQLIGKQAADLVGKVIFDFIPESIRESRKHHLFEAVKEGIAIRFEDVVNGRTWENTIYPIKDSDGRVLRVAAFGHNITRIKQVEAERRLLIDDLTLAKEKAIQSDLLKSSLLSNMSHEFRTPLNGILGFADILKENTFDNEQIMMIDIIKDSGKRLFQTLDDILTIAELESSSCQVNLTPIDLKTIIHSISNRYMLDVERKALKLNIQLTDYSEFELISDKELVDKSLDRIFRNAIKFTEAGEITIKTDVNFTFNDYSIIISITDTGIGIAAENQEKVFKSFRQVSEGMGREFEGNGLGLSIAKQLIELLNGRIYLKSRQGVGTSFFVELPLRLKSSLKKPVFNTSFAENEKDALKNMINKYGKKPKVLLVEDNQINSNLVISYLAGYVDITHVSTGQEAIDFAQKIIYDFVLMDINLGMGINGIEATREIRKIEGYLQTPVAAITGYVLKGEKDMLFSLGLNYYLGKPFRINDLHELVGTILEDLVRIRMEE